MNDGKRELWKENSNSLLVLYSILAATTGVFIGIILTEKCLIESLYYVPLVILLLSFWIFIFSAEGMTDALDENDVFKYVAVIFLYNVAVILLISGILIIIYLKLHFHSCISCIILFIIILFLAWHWIRDFGNLLFDNNTDHENYIRNLKNNLSVEDKKNLSVEDKKIRKGWSWTKCFLYFRKKLHGSIIIPNVTS